MQASETCLRISDVGKLPVTIFKETCHVILLQEFGLRTGPLETQFAYYSIRNDRMNTTNEQTRGSFGWVTTPRGGIS